VRFFTKRFSVNIFKKELDKYNQKSKFDKKQIMRFHTRKWVKPEDLNPNSTLFGGRLLAWIDEELALYSIVQLQNPKIVTKHMSEINFRSSAKQGDIVEIGIDVVKFGNTSITLACQVRNMMTREIIISIDTITMVSLGEDGKPKAHGKTQIEYIKDRLSD
jgi:acyl-CoA thioesterase YciA